jgi:hypothetical protein
MWLVMANEGTKIGRNHANRRLLTRLKHGSYETGKSASTETLEELSSCYLIRHVSTTSRRLHHHVFVRLGGGRGKWGGLTRSHLTGDTVPGGRARRPTPLAVRLALRGSEEGSVARVVHKVLVPFEVQSEALAKFFH